MYRGKTLHHHQHHHHKRSKILHSYFLQISRLEPAFNKTTQDLLTVKENFSDNRKSNPPSSAHAHPAPSLNSTGDSDSLIAVAQFWIRDTNSARVQSASKTPGSTPSSREAVKKSCKQCRTVVIYWRLCNANQSILRLFTDAKGPLENHQGLSSSWQPLSWRPDNVLDAILTSIW